MPVGKPAPPRPRRPDCTTSSTIASGPSDSARSRPREAAMGPVVVERERIDDAASRKGQPRLALEPRDIVRDAEPQRMAPALGAVRQHGIEHACGISRRDRPKGDAPRRRRNLDQRLQPIEPARAGPHDLDIDIAGRTRPRAARAATSSAPTASAPASQGTKTRSVIAAPLPARRRGAAGRAVRPRGRRSSRTARSRTARGSRPARA